MKSKEAKAFAPASIGNVAVGFDMLGHSLSGCWAQLLRRLPSPYFASSPLAGKERTPSMMAADAGPESIVPVTRPSGSTLREREPSPTCLAGSSFACFTPA